MHNLQLGRNTIANSAMYRHELPEKNDLSNQNIKDRYYGRNDPVAKKIMTGHATQQGLQPPEDQAIVSSIIYYPQPPYLCHLLQTSLFLSSLPESVNEQSLRTAVVSSLPSIPPSSVKSVVHVAKSR